MCVCVLGLFVLALISISLCLARSPPPPSLFQFVLPFRVVVLCACATFTLCLSLAWTAGQGGRSSIEGSCHSRRRPRVASPCCMPRQLRHISVRHLQLIAHFICAFICIFSHTAARLFPTACPLVTPLPRSPLWLAASAATCCCVLPATRCLALQFNCPDRAFLCSVSLSSSCPLSISLSVSLPASPLFPGFVSHVCRTA